MTDGIGLYGMMLQYALVGAFVGGAALFFLYFWWKGALNMDESPKWQILDKKEDL